MDLLTGGIGRTSSTNEETDWTGQRAPDLSLSDYLTAIHAHLQYGNYRPYGDIVLLSENNALLSDGTFVYPALAIPTDQKNEVICPTDHVDVLRTALQSDPAILVIGNRGLDTDLMALLQQSGIRGSKMPFRVVDPDEGGQVYSRFAKALGRSPFGQSSIGFRDFVESGAAEGLLDKVRDATGATSAVIDPHRL